MVYCVGLLYVVRLRRIVHLPLSTALLRLLKKLMFPKMIAERPIKVCLKFKISVVKWHRMKAELL